MTSIGFQYSLDGGSTWSTALVLACVSVRVTLMPFDESDSSGTPAMGAGAECEKKTPRLTVNIVTGSNEFNPALTASGDTNWITIQKWACAPLRRIYNVAGSGGIDGWTEFDSSSNTNYVNLANDPSYEIEDFDKKTENGRRIRHAKLELRAKYRTTL